MWPMLEIAEQSFHGKVMMLINFIVKKESRFMVLAETINLQMNLKRKGFLIVAVKFTSK
jgi:hypothetical protein